VVLWLLLALLFFTMAAQAFPSVYNYFTIEVLDFSSSQIGRSLGAFGITFAVFQALAVGPLVKRFGETAVVVMGMAAAALAFAGIAFIKEPTWLYVLIALGAVSGLAAPAINGVMSRQVPDNSQGELQGAVNAANSLATIIGPLMATQIFAYFTLSEVSPSYFPGAPFILASALVLVAVGIFLYVALRFDLSHRPSIASHPRTLEMAPPGQILVPTPDNPEDDTENGDGDIRPDEPLRPRY
jgi:DHA1 family tetracycline resistance protein-like MFS transporter